MSLGPESILFAIQTSIIVLNRLDQNSDLEVFNQKLEKLYPLGLSLLEAWISLAFSIPCGHVAILQDWDFGFAGGGYLEPCHTWAHDKIRRSVSWGGHVAGVCSYQRRQRTIRCIPPKANHVGVQNSITETEERKWTGVKCRAWPGRSEVPRVRWLPAKPNYQTHDPTLPEHQK